jgi:hypothetical protein
MDEAYEQIHQLRALAMRVAALEDNVAYLEKWCEEQQDTLDRAAGPIAYDYEGASEIALPPRAVLRIVDLRDGETSDDEDGDTIVAFVETDHDRRVHQIRSSLNRIRTRLTTLSAKPAGRTAP